MKKIVFIIIVLLLPCRALGIVPSTDHGHPIANSQVFSRIAQAAPKVKTLQSDFIQEKHLSILEDVLVSKGRFYYEKPDRLRWEIREPVYTGFTVDGNKAKRWHGRNSSPQTFETRQVPFIKVFAEQVFAWAGADFKWLEQRYGITVLKDNPVIMKLVPISSQEKKFVDYLRIVFTSDAGYVSLVEVHEKSGDFTLIKFINTVVNSPLQKDLF